MKIFKDSRSNYGARKIKIELEKEGYQVSGRKISRIMRASGLISKYLLHSLNLMLINVMNLKFLI